MHGYRCLLVRYDEILLFQIHIIVIVHIINLQFIICGLKYKFKHDCILNYIKVSFVSIDTSSSPSKKKQKETNKENVTRIEYKIILPSYTISIISTMVQM